MFPGRQPRPSPPRSARRVVPLLTSTAEKPRLLLTSRCPFPEGRADLSSPRGCSSASSATQVSLSLSSIRSLGSGSSERDVSALARTDTVVPAVNWCSHFALVWSSEEINTLLCILSEISTFRCSGSGVGASNIRCNTKYCIFSITSIYAPRKPIGELRRWTWSSLQLKVSEELLLVAGPSRKRRISTSSDSESEKKEKKRSKMRGQRSPVIKPRRLFKACKMH